MKISERIRRANGEKPDYAIDDIGDIGHWQGMNDAALIAEAEELVQLSEDQQVVLEWFKNEKKDQPFATVADFFTAYFEGAESEVPLNTMVAFEYLTNKQQFQVLAAFASWGNSFQNGNG